MKFVAFGFTFQKDMKLLNSREEALKLPYYAEVARNPFKSPLARKA